MPIELSVGPPVLTINQGSTFMVTDLNGEIAADSEAGLFADDTRFLSYYAIFANGQPWVRLASSATTYYAAQIHLTNPAFTTEGGEVPAGSVMLTISRAIGEGVHEDLDVVNWGLTPVRFNLEVATRSDFADLFEVKTHKFVRRGRIVTRWHERLGELHTAYSNRDFRRRLIYRVLNSGCRPDYANGRVTFEIKLTPGANWHTCAEYVLVQGQRSRAPVRVCDYCDATGQPCEADELQRHWLESTTDLTSPKEDVNRLFQQSIEDMGALRLHDHDFAPDVWLPAAGVPWFVTIFGRDSLIVSLQNMIVYPRFALGTLQKLAELQARELDPWRDAQPGKIPHEIRFGELAHLKRVPHTPYYGTADATALYLIALHEAWRWLGEDSILREYRDTALRCLEWIDRYGDADGDGFQEYETSSAQGYENMGWKDAGDAVVYPDGSQVKQPKALCELQGYVFDAWIRMAEAFDALGERESAASLREKAAALGRRFEERFWCEDLGFYAFGLDAEKQPIRTVASNAGHLLWSGIASREHAAKVVGRLLQPDMWSGWGIRTLSADNPAYNPISYQRGSVWPHDNGIIALGFKRYGYSGEAAQVGLAIVDSARYFAGYRLPELYAGIPREPGTFPVQYLGANVPQAWAAGSIFHLLQALTGIRADAPRQRLYVDPVLPEWLPELMLRGITVGQAKVDLQVWRGGDRTLWDARVTQGHVEVEPRAWQPWLQEGPQP